MAKQVKHFYEFGPFRLEPDERQLLRNGQAVPLTPKAFDMLVALVEHSGHLMDKDELMKCVWPGSFVEEANLSHHVYKLREVLGAGPGGKGYIDTVPRRGYRFVAAVIEFSDDSAEEVVEVAHAKAHVTIEEDDQYEPDLPASAEASKQLLASTADQLVPAQSRTVTPLLRAPGSKPGKSKVIIGAGALLLVLAAGVFLFRAGRFRNHSGAAVNGQIHSIAVLPFKPLAADNRDETLELGMADTLIARLGSVREIAVRPTSAVRRYTDVQQDAVAAGRELAVDSVLDGTIQRQGERIRMTVRLLSVRDGTQLWADKFDEKFTDIFAVQDAISERLTRALALNLTGREKELLARRHTDNPEAYQLYLKGRYLWSKFDEADLKKSIEYFQQAIDRDPNYALSYAGLAAAHNVLGNNYQNPNEAAMKAKAAAARALELDETLVEGHEAQAAIKIFYDWDWPGAEQELKRAVELNPNYANAQVLYCYYFRNLGRSDEAVAAIKRALELDPLAFLANAELGRTYTYARQYDQAIAQLSKALEVEPNARPVRFRLAGVYGLKQRYPEALAEANNVIAHFGRDQNTLSLLGWIYGNSGQPGAARKLLSELQEQAKHDYVFPCNLARIHIALGEKDEAFALLDQAFKERDGNLIDLKVDPIYDPLRSDPRFAELLQRMNLL